MTHTLWTPCALALFHKTEVQKSCFDCSDFQPFTTVWKIGSMSTQKAADTTQGFEVCAHSENDLLKFKERRRMWVKKKKRETGATLNIWEFTNGSWCAATLHRISAISNYFEFCAPRREAALPAVFTVVKNQVKTSPQLNCWIMLRLRRMALPENLLQTSSESRGRGVIKPSLQVS